MRQHAIPRTLVATAAIVALAACENTRRGAEQDAEIAAEKAKQHAEELEADARRGAAKASEVTAEAVTDVKKGAEKAAEATSEALDEAGQRAAAAKRTLDVKTALMADKGVDASRIDVDSEYLLKIVHLRGAVSTEAEKTSAEAIALAHADGWKVSNELVVAPR